MPLNHQEQWPEHAVCARCAAPLGDDYQESPLGLRFCKDCFDGAIREKVKERAAVIYVRGRCSKCGRSLINGYRLNKFGVIYCLHCSDFPQQQVSEPAAGEEAETEDDAKGRRKAGIEGRAEIALLVLVVAAHLFYFVDYLLSGRLLEEKTFFRPLVSLDLLTLILLVISRRLSPSWITLMWTLLLASGFFILIVKGIIAVL